jgi:hypothetical protein
LEDVEKPDSRWLEVHVDVFVGVATVEMVVERVKSPFRDVDSKEDRDGGRTGAGVSRTEANNSSSSASSTFVQDLFVEGLLYDVEGAREM